MWSFASKSFPSNPYVQLTHYILSKFICIYYTSSGKTSLELPKGVASATTVQGYLGYHLNRTKLHLRNVATTSHVQVTKTAVVPIRPRSKSSKLNDQPQVAIHGMNYGIIEVSMLLIVKKVSPFT